MITVIFLFFSVLTERSYSAIYSDRIIGQHVDDYTSTVGNTHIRHWQPYTAQDQIVYVADFNYLLNGMQLNYVIATLPDPLAVVRREFPDLTFSLVFWRSSILFEEFGNRADISLYLTYKLDIHPGKSDFLWNEITGRLVIPCRRLGCPEIPHTTEGFIYLGWIFDTTIAPYDPISFSSHTSAGTSRVYEVKRSSIYHLQVGSSRTIVLHSAVTKVRLVSLHYNDNEIEVLGVKSSADNSVVFDMNFNYTTCFVNRRLVRPFIMILKLVELEDIDDIHYITIPHNVYADLYSAVADVDSSNAVRITLNPSNHSHLFEYAQDLNSEISSIYIRSTCDRHLSGYSTPRPSPKPDSRCGDDGLYCSSKGSCGPQQTCLCDNDYLGLQCGLYKGCLPSMCPHEWQACLEKDPALSDDATNYTCHENVYFSRLGISCESDTDCADTLFSHCASSVCVCDVGYMYSSTVVQGLRQQLCVKNHLICDWDVQCHHLHTDMVCKTPSERHVTDGSSNKRCVCSDISLRDPDNGLCTQPLESEGSAQMKWRIGYTMAITGAAVFIFIMFVFAGVISRRSNKRALNRQEYLNKKFANAIQLEKDIQWDKEQKKLNKKAARRLALDKLAEEENSRHEQDETKLPPIVTRHHTNRHLTSSASAARSGKHMLDAVKRIRKERLALSSTEGYTADSSAAGESLVTGGSSTVSSTTHSSTGGPRSLGRPRSFGGLRTVPGAIRRKQRNPVDKTRSAGFDSRGRRKKKTLQPYLSSFTNPPIKYGSVERPASSKPAVNHQSSQANHTSSKNRRLELTLKLKPR